MKGEGFCFLGGRLEAERGVPRGREAPRRWSPITSPRTLARRGVRLAAPLSTAGRGCPQGPRPPRKPAGLGGRPGTSQSRPGRRGVFKRLGRGPGGSGRVSGAALVALNTAAARGPARGLEGGRPSEAQGRHAAGFSRAAGPRRRAAGARRGRGGGGSGPLSRPRPFKATAYRRTPATPPPPRPRDRRGARVRASPPRLRPRRRRRRRRPLPPCRPP